jgi:hypothetical protein
LPETSAIADQSSQIPAEFALEQNYPNPFNPKTIIGWHLAVDSNVELSIYDLAGRKVTTLVSEKQPAGRHQVEWNASGIASGVYLYKIEASDFHETKKLVLLK